jgi:hypothetical protein
LGSSFADRIRDFRKVLDNPRLRASELREQLNALQELEEALPPRPTRPAEVKKSRRRKRSERPENAGWIQDWWTADQHWQQTVGPRLQIVNSIRAEIQARLHGTPGRSDAKSVPWRFLPKTDLSEATVMALLRDFQSRRRDVQVDEARLRDAFRLSPEEVYVGQDDFDGYFAFCFERERSVLLDHPVVGNAAYVFGSDWRSLSRLSKKELLDSHRGQFVRVVHSADWQRKIRTALRGMRRDRRSPKALEPSAR